MMNEKIKELALNAGFDYDVWNFNQGNFYGYEGRWINGDITRFAQMVAFECLMICQNHYTIEGIAQNIEKDIKETFGIE